MKKIHEVSQSIGVSKRTLQYYDEIGLLPPTKYTESGYRLYDDAAVEKLWQILLLKELGYQLTDIKIIMDNPAFDLRDSIGKQIEALTKKKQRFENLIGYARIIKMTGVIPFNFEEYGDITFDEFIENSKNTWNMNTLSEGTDEISNSIDYEVMQSFQGLIDERLNQQEKEWNEDELGGLAEIFSNVSDINKLLDHMECIVDIAELIDQDENSKEVHEHVEKLYTNINSLFGRPISLNGFSLWGKMLVSGGDSSMIFENYFGEETTAFISKAIQAYCNNISME